MKDINKVKNLLHELDIGFNEINPNYSTCTEIYLVEGHKNVGGYSGFYTLIRFNSETGKFVNIGAYE